MNTTNPNPNRRRGFRMDNAGQITWTGIYAGLTRTYVVVDAQGRTNTSNRFVAKLAETYRQLTTNN
jgi:hypothetical protein